MAGARSWLPTRSRVGISGLRQTDDSAAPFPLEGGRGSTVLVGIAGEDDQIDLFADGGFDDGVQRLQEVEHPQRKAGRGIMPAVVLHIDVRVGEVEQFHLESFRG